MATPLPINELDTVVLKVAQPEHRLDVGALGTVVAVRDGGAQLDVEFANAAGTTSTRITVSPAQVRRSTHEDA